MAVVRKPGMDIHIGEEHYQMSCQLRRSFQGYTGYAAPRRFLLFADELSVLNEVAPHISFLAIYVLYLVCLTIHVFHILSFVNKVPVDRS